MRFLRTLPLYIGLGMIAASASVSAQAADPQSSYTVELNKTEIVRLPGAASSVIVGNPKIADVTVQSSDLLFVVGRGYGETNLIILDALGNTMMNADLQVVNTLSHNGVRLYNGSNRETYSCIPFCGPSPVLGDERSYITGNTSAERPLTSGPAFNAAPPPAATPNTNAPAGGRPNTANPFTSNQINRAPN